MYYLVLFLAISLSFLFFYRVIAPINEPDFRVRNQLDARGLNLAVRELAIRSRRVRQNGRGLSTKALTNILTQAYRQIAQRVKNGEAVHSFEQWLYDNFYKVNSRLQELKNQLFKFCFLPHSSELPRVYELMQYVVKSCGGYVNEEIIFDAVEAFNSETQLSYAEIRALKAALIYALIEFIAIFCAKSNVIERKRRRAKHDIKKNRIDLASISFNSYIYAFSQYASSEVKKNLASICLDNGQNLDERINSFIMMTAGYNGRVSAAISSLMSIDRFFTDEFTLTLSPVNNMLFEEAGIFYKENSIATKNLYLYHIYHGAKRKKISELAQARAVIQKSSLQKKDISFFILPPPKNKNLAYFFIFVHLFLCAALSIFFSIFMGQYFVATALLCVPVFFALCGIFIASVSKYAFKRRRLPFVDSKQLTKQNTQSLLTVCRLIGSEAELDETFAHFETTICANNASYFSYCLLIDLPCSNGEKLSVEDEKIVSKIKNYYNNSEYKDKILILIRKRKKVTGEQKYQGWEKKRGALIELCRLILHNQCDNFYLNLGQVKSFKYIITLDSDTLINCSRNLVCLMEHPYNVDTAIMGIGMRTNDSDANSTAFSKLFSGGRGLDSYQGFVADMEFDVFASGNYTGKGIFRVKEFYERAGSSFEDNKILSHDYIEGALCSCQNSGECGLDTFPKNFSQFLTRQLRWIRGDYQLIPYLGNRIKNSSGERVKSNISPIAKWHMFCNLIIPLVPIFCIGLLFLSLVSSSPLYLIGVAFSLMCVHFLLSIRNSVLNKKHIWLGELSRQLVMIMLMPTIAFYTLHSIVITIYRLIKNKNLLQWNVFAHAKGSINYSPCYIAAAIFIASAAVYSLPVYFYALGGLFLLGGAVSFMLSKPSKQKKYTSESLDATLDEVFRKTYSYFATQADEQNNFLVADNYQETYNIGFVKRTSPTNIGFMLISHVAAYEMGLITLQRLNELLENAITTIEKLPKYKGNLYNWIDTVSLAPLKPCYVSLVDSGNFLACITMLLAYTSGGLKKRIQKLIDETQLQAMFDYKRGLFTIGYNADTGEYDSNHYDLAGSEAMLSYLIAIATGKIDCSVWNNLCFDAVKYGSKSMLVSWTGGMFEHLMGGLFFDFCKGTLFYNSTRAAVKAQIRYAKKNSHSIFGISESQYACTDNEGLYQYKAFGIADISLSSSVSGNVVAPYASMLALNCYPKQVDKNLRLIIKQGLQGRFGLYEAMDIKKNEIVRTYMSHHQGMIIAAICNYLCGGALTKAFKSLPCVRAAGLLLTDSRTLYGKRKIRQPQKSDKIAPQSIYAGGRHATPYANFLSANKYASVLSENGKGYAVLDKTLLTRFSSFGDSQTLTLNIGEKSYNLYEGECQINADSTCFEKCTPSFCAKTKAFILPSGIGEVRQVELINKTAKPIRVKISTFCEIALNDKAADTAHPAFENLFIKTTLEKEEGFVYAERLSQHKRPFFAHYIVPPNGEDIQYTTSKHNYLGRGDTHLDFGQVLDPVFYSSFTLELLPQKKCEFNVFYCASYSLSAIKSFARLSRTKGYLERVKGFCYALGQSMQMTTQEKQAASGLLFASSQTSHSSEFADSFFPRPIVSIEVKNQNDLQALRHKLGFIKKLFNYLIEFNTVILYTQKHGYLQTIQSEISSLVDELSLRTAAPPNCTLQLINCAIEQKKAAFVMQNSVKLGYADFGEIELNQQKNIPPKFDLAKMPMPQLVETKAVGGFTDEGAYFMDLSNCDTPAVWSNIVASEKIGTIITESGGGYTFGKNSRQQKLTAFYNDPLIDKQSEFIVLGERGCLWSITKKPIKKNANYFALHDCGYSEFSCNYNGILAKQRVFIDRRGETKYYQILLENQTNEHRNIDLMLAFEPVLGDFKQSTAHALQITAQNFGLCVKNIHTDLSLYALSSLAISSHAFYKEAFTDSEGNITKNAALINKGSELFLSMQTQCVIEPHGKKTVVFTLGTDSTPEHANTEQILADAKRYYSSLSCIQPKKYDTDFQRLLKWLPYQVLCSRFIARAGYYQVGGAIGFRDQLQDSLALLHVDPSIVRSHICHCAAHQFEAGDVQHWWHEGAVGVRTTCSDDRLFLPLAVAEYIFFTSDTSILSERVPYLAPIKLPSGESSVYAKAEFTSRCGSIHEHCIAAIYKSLDFAQNGLAKIHGGDWNDAMDEVGKNGEGSSVWLSMFLYYVIERYLPFVTNADDKKTFFASMQSLKEAIEKAYDGEWYKRAYTDEGVPLGSVESSECKIDLLTQSWAVLSGACGEKRVQTSMYSAKKWLVDEEIGIIKLFTPPFKKTKNIGYIAAYPEGVRENGGQYTHAAVWYIMALIKQNRIDEAWKMFCMINPSSHSDRQRYALEPYVLAADVYSGENAGRGGWSFYTGSASWYYRCLVEEFFGIRRRGSILSVQPNLPSCLNSIELAIKIDNCKFTLVLDNTQRTGEWRAVVGNIQYNCCEIPFTKVVPDSKITIKRFN